MFGALGTKVTVVDKRDRVLSFLDSEIGEAFQYLLRRQNVTFRLREQRRRRGPRRRRARPEGAPRVRQGADRRDGAVRDRPPGRHRAAAARTRPASRPTRAAASRSTRATARPCRTSSRSATSSGGGLAATAMEQGRIATLHAFGEPVQTLPELVPTGVYAMPEIAMVGQTEEQLTDAAIPYVTGVARWSELARGLMSGDEDGMLKLLVDPDNRCILGVHVIGTGATDLVHIGQAVMGGHADDRLPRHRRLQLPDVRRVLQGRRARRDEPHQGLSSGGCRAAGRRGPPRPPRAPPRRPPRRRPRPPRCASSALLARLRARLRRAAVGEPLGEVAERLRELARDHEDLVRLALRELRQHLQVLVGQQPLVRHAVVDRPGTRSRSPSPRPRRAGSPPCARPRP